MTYHDFVTTGKSPLTTPREPRLTRLLKWSWDFAPTWMDWFFDHGLMRLIADARCLVHGHEGYVDMDGRSIVCLWCHDPIGVSS